MGALLAPVAGAVVGGLFQQDAASKADYAQRVAEEKRMAEEQRVREQLRQDTEAQRAIADKAFQDYQAGLITYAQAQQQAAQAMQNVQNTIGQSQLSDTTKAMEMSKFQPYGIKTGTGSTFFDQASGQAGVNLSPELQRYQQGMYGQALEASGNIASTPEQAAQQYMQQQQGLLQPQRQAEDQALRAQQLQRGRIGLGISSEAAGAGTGGMVNPEQFAQDRARAQADASIAANATIAGQQQAASQLGLASGLFNAGNAPEQQMMNNLNTGVNIGNVAQQSGMNQANLYAGGMGDYYRSLMGAQESANQGMLAVPGAMNTGMNEAYSRQQTYLGGLQNNNLQYQPMSTPQAYIPGSAYMNATIGSGLMNAGMQGIQNYMNAPTRNTNPVSGVSSFGQNYANQTNDPIGTMFNMGYFK